MSEQTLAKPSRRQRLLLKDIGGSAEGDGWTSSFRGDVGERTLDRCIEAGWLEEGFHEMPGEYRLHKWRLTPAGRAALEGAGAP